MVEPFRIAFLGHAVADEGQTGSAKSEQFVRVYREVAGRLFAERGIRCAVLEEVASHPVILACPREVLNSFSPVAAMQLPAAFTRRADQHYSEARIECHSHERGFAVSRDAFDADLF